MATSTTPAAMSSFPIELRPSKFEPRSVLAPEVHAPEEVPELERGCLRRVRAVRRVVLDRGAELLAQRTRVRLGWISRTHQRAPFLDGVRRLEAHDDAGA